MAYLKALYKLNVNCQWTDEQVEAKASQLVSKMNLKEKVMFLSDNWAMMRDNMKYKRSYNPVPIESHGNKRRKINTIAFTDGPRGVALGAVELIMGLAGYDGLAEVQSQTTMTVIVFLYNILPLILFVLMFIISINYKVDKIRPQMEAELKAKRGAD